MIPKEKPTGPAVGLEQSSGEASPAALHSSTSPAGGQAATQARQEIRCLLDGGSPSDRAVADFEGWADSVSALRTAYESGGTPAVRKVWTALARANPELTRLLSEGTAVARASWEPFTLADAHKPRPPMTYLVEGLIELPSLNILFGPPGSLKSMAAGDLAICVSAGQPWLEPLPGAADVLPWATSQVPVLWCDFDNGVRRTHERFEALSHARAPPEATPFFYVSMPSPWLDAGDDKSMAALTNLLIRYEAKLIVIDNLGVVSGDADENSAQMVQVMSKFRQIAEGFGAAVILIHHQRKSIAGKHRVGERLRGHSSIEAAIDLALLVERVERGSSITMRSTKTRGADVWPFSALFSYEHRAGSDELAEARFYGIPVDDPQGDSAIIATILNVVGRKPHILKGSLKDQAKAVHPDCGVNRISALIDHLVERGRLTMTLGASNARHYDVQD